MPSFNITVPETVESVTRPVIYSIIETIKKYLLINDIRVIFPGDIGQWTQVSGNLTDKSRESKFTSSRYILITVDESPVESNLNSTAVYYDENPPIILDKNIKLKVTPVYSLTNSLMTVKFITYNKDEALRWYYNVRTQLAKMQNIYINTVKYHYVLPFPLVDLIETIYKLTQSVAPTGLTYQQFVQNTFTSRATMVASLDGASKRLAIAETQTRLLGKFDFSPLPEKPELIDDIQAWVCSFVYNYTYQLPMSLNMFYPLMVHNQLLPEPYLEYDLDPYHYYSKEFSFPATLEALRDFEQYRMFDRDPPFRLPKIDDFIASTTIPGTKAIFYALIQLEESDLTFICNLNDLDYITLDQHILDFIKDGEYQYITQPYKSIFNVAMYTGDNIYDPSCLYVDSNLNVYSTNSLNLQKVYHLRFSVTFDYFSIDIAALERCVSYVKSPDPVNTNVIQNEYSDFGTPMSTITNTPAVTASEPIINTDKKFYFDRDQKLPMNVEIIENYENSALEIAAQDANTLSTLTEEQKEMVENNTFYNTNIKLPNIKPGYSKVFELYCNSIFVDPVNVNNLYRSRTSKNLFFSPATTDNYLVNTRSETTNKSLNLFASPLASLGNNIDYVGFRSVMLSGITTIGMDDLIGDK